MCVFNASVSCTSLPVVAIISLYSFVLLLSPVTILLDTTCLVRVLYKIIVVFPVNLVIELRDNSLFVPGLIF